MDAEDSLKVRADRMTGVSVGMMPPRPSGSLLGSTAAARTGAGRLLVEMQLQLGAGPAAEAGEMLIMAFCAVCCLTCQSLVSPLLWVHVSYLDP